MLLLRSGEAQETLPAGFLARFDASSERNKPIRFRDLAAHWYEDGLDRQLILNVLQDDPSPLSVATESHLNSPGTDWGTRTASNWDMRPGAMARHRISPAEDFSGARDKPMLTLQPTVIAAGNPEEQAGSKTRLQNSRDANPAMQSPEPV